MFYDRAKIFVKAGDGGNGSASFRRERYVPMGGPDGGDGGRGGSVYLRVDVGETTLIDYRYKQHFKAAKGGNGAKQKKHGKAGEDLYLPVPPGTVVRDADTDELIADLIVPQQSVMVARGGKGGLGNVHFATSTMQAPTFAEKGEPGEERWLQLELKILADVGIIGFPNVGKSTLVSRVTAASPKIADYPFTTLSPTLGVATVDEFTFVIADIPGLIEGAHEGVGLGHDFLRHVERTRVLIHMVDVSPQSGRDPLRDYETINEELRLFDPSLLEKPQVVALNKIDVPGAVDRAVTAEAALKKGGIRSFRISAEQAQGLEPLVRAVATILQEMPPAPAEPTEEVRVYRPLEAPGEFSVSIEEDAFVVTGKAIERMAAMTDVQNRQAIMRFERRIERMGVLKALEEAGVQNGDTVRIGRIELIWGTPER